MGSGLAPTRILVVDDHRALSEALSRAIDLEPDMEGLGVAGTLQEAYSATVTLCPDVIILGVRLPDGDGIDGIARIRELSPEGRVIVLTAHGDAETAVRAASAGASAFLTKTSSFAQVLEVIRAGSDDGLILDRAVLAGMLHGLQVGETSHPPDLTQREHEVLLLLGQGLDARAIAKRMGIGTATTRGHVQRILAKLGAHSQLEAVLKAIRAGWIPSPAGDEHTS